MRLALLGLVLVGLLPFFLKIQFSIEFLFTDLLQDDFWRFLGYLFYVLFVAVRCCVSATLWILDDRCQSDKLR